MKWLRTFLVPGSIAVAALLAGFGFTVAIIVGIVKLIF